MEELTVLTPSYDRPVIHVPFDGQFDTTLARSKDTTLRAIGRWSGESGVINVTFQLRASDFHMVSGKRINVRKMPQPKDPRPVTSYGRTTQRGNLKMRLKPGIYQVWFHSPTDEIDD